jgi:hypothetical protein
LIKTDGDAVVLGIKPNLFDRRVLPNQPHDTRPRIAAWFGIGLIGDSILFHTKLLSCNRAYDLSGICHSLCISCHMPQKPGRK